MVAAQSSHLIKGLGFGPDSEGNTTPPRGPRTAPAHSQPSLGLAPADIREKMTTRATRRVGGLLLPGPPTWITMTA